MNTIEELIGKAPLYRPRDPDLQNDPGRPFYQYATAINVVSVAQIDNNAHRVAVTLKTGETVSAPAVLFAPFGDMTDPDAPELVIFAPVPKVGVVERSAFDQDREPVPE